jgi:pantoate--beta-alanine ligase
MQPQYGTAAIRRPNTPSNNSLDIVDTRAGLQAALQPLRSAGQRIVLVPTMGYLHEGHLSLVDAARNHGDVVVMSIYVNPLQFGPQEDLARYPRDLQRDSDMAQARGVDFIFAPGDAEMYAVEPAVTVHAADLSERLCGLFRPGHFEGVLTVVAKLFNIVQPDAAVFGQKDFQQWVLIKRMVRDLSFALDIIVAPLVREPDGLAMSSRNIFLSEADRASALKLSRALRSGQETFAAGHRQPSAITDAARSVLANDRSIRVQYVELVDEESLSTPEEAGPNNVLAVAAIVGNTRLIDNVVIGTD